MDVEETGKLESLDTDMLQLQEVSPFALKSSPHVAEELFSQWLSLPDTSRLVNRFIVHFNLTHLCFSMNE
jgi:serine/threonine-protein phosphatase 2A regulatory subunit B''